MNNRCNESNSNDFVILFNTVYQLINGKTSELGEENFYVKLLLNEEMDSPSKVSFTANPEEDYYEGIRLFSQVIHLVSQ
jgi:hypothetical protein